MHDFSPQPLKFNGLRASLYVLLIATGALTLLLRPYILTAIRTGELDAISILLFPLAFTLVLLAVVVDEIWLLRRGLKPKKMRLLPVLFGFLLLLIILPASVQEYQTRRISSLQPFNFFHDMVKSKDARVRALVVMAAGRAPQSGDWLYFIDEGLKDPDPLVQGVAKRVLTERSGIEFVAGNAGLLEARRVAQSLDTDSLTNKTSKP